MEVRIKINEAYGDLLYDKHRYLLIYGGAGAGKSYFAAQKIILRTLTEPGSRILVVRKVARTLRYSAFQQVKDVIADAGLGPLFKVKDNEMRIEAVNGNLILFAGLDDPEKLKSIAGITSAWIEEATDLTADEFEQVDLRVRHPHPAGYYQIILTFNPIMVTHWLRQRFFDRKDPNARIKKVTYRDNVFIPEEYRQKLMGLKDINEALWQVYAEGNWARPSNLVYQNWTVEAEMPCDLADFEDLAAGVDFGFINPSVFLLVGFRDDEIWVLDEIYVTRRTIKEFARIIADRLVELKLDKEILKRKKILVAYADPSAPDKIVELQTALDPLGVVVTKAKNDVLPGIGYLQTKKIRILNKCTATIKEIESYSYQDEHKELPAKYNDHCMDALRYAAFSHRGNEVGILYVDI
jgi:phage terminase large subunit